jgi:transposase
MDSTPDDIAALRAALAEARARADAAERKVALVEAEFLQARARASSVEALIAHLKLEIERLQRELRGRRSERTARLLDQLELELEELEAKATEDELAAEAAPAMKKEGGSPRRRPSRKPFPDHLPRERVVVPAPTSCACCGSARLAKLGETITETAERVPASWKIVQTVREKFTCRDCEAITQPPAPFHATPRGWAGPNLLATILFEKFGQHQPLNRQVERFAREGMEVSLSTAADQVGAAAATLRPLHDLLEAHVFAAERLHGDDTTVPVLAKGKTITGRLWTYVRDDAPFGGPAPPAAVFRYSRDRTAAHPNEHLAGFTGLLQADAYAGYNRLFEADRRPGPITGAFCLAHARRKFFVLADIAASARRGPSAPPISPLALEAVRRLDRIFALEREINGRPAAERLVFRREHVVPVVADLEAWMRRERAAMSKHAPVAKAMDYMLTRWNGFVRFLDDGRVCVTNNAAERALCQRPRNPPHFGAFNFPHFPR